MKIDNINPKYINSLSQRIAPDHYVSDALISYILSSQGHEAYSVEKSSAPSNNTQLASEALYNRLNRIQLQNKDWSEIGIAVYRMGVGMYHSGLVVDNIEWHFWEGHGVQGIQRYYDDVQKSVVSISYVPFVEYVPIETISVSPVDIAKLCTHLGSTMYSVHTYDILMCNCNHFTFGVLQCLGLGSKMPPWINRLANTTGSIWYSIFFHTVHSSALPFLRYWVDLILQRPAFINRFAGLRNNQTLR